MTSSTPEHPDALIDYFVTLLTDTISDMTYEAATQEDYDGYLQEAIDECLARKSVAWLGKLRRAGHLPEERLRSLVKDMRAGNRPGGAPAPRTTVIGGGWCCWWCH